jgi:hypothetical protein
MVMLSVNQWTKITRSADPLGKSMILIGESGAVYSIYADETVAVVAVDEDADGKSDGYYEAPSLQKSALLVWGDEVIRAHGAISSIRQSVLTQAVLDRADPNLESSRFDLSVEDAQDLLDQLQIDQWEHRPAMPSLDLTVYDRMSLVSVGSRTVVITLYRLPAETLVVIQEDEDERLMVYKAPMALSSALLSTLQTLADALIPDHELANLVFAQGYIGPMQYIYEPSRNDPSYFFALTPAQQITVLDWLKPTTWVKQASAQPTSLYAEFAMMDTEGIMYYFTEVATATIIVTIIDPLQPSQWVEYSWVTSDFMSINTQLMTYFTPGGPQPDLLNAVYTSASFYEGEVMDMTSPDITVSLSASQSKTIKDFIDPFSWKQAVDIPPMGPAVGFTLEDGDGRQYTFLFIGEYVLVTVFEDELSPVTWWKGSMSGAEDARTFLLTLAP